MASFYTLTEDQVEILLIGLIHYTVGLAKAEQLTLAKLKEIDELRHELQGDD